MQLEGSLRYELLHSLSRPTGLPAILHDQDATLPAITHPAGRLVALPHLQFAMV